MNERAKKRSDEEISHRLNLKDKNALQVWLSRNKSKLHDRYVSQFQNDKIDKNDKNDKVLIKTGSSIDKNDKKLMKKSKTDKKIDKKSNRNSNLIIPTYQEFKTYIAENTDHEFHEYFDKHLKKNHNLIMKALDVVRDMN